MALNDIYRLTLEVASLTTGTPINNVLWFRETVDHADTGDVDLAEDFIAHVDTNPLRRWQHPVFRWNSVRVQRMWPTVDPPQQVFYVPTAAGLSSIGPHPSVCAMVVRLVSSLPGRSFNGRLYLGGFAAGRAFTGVSALVDDGHWSPTMVSEIANWLITIIVRYTAGTADWEWHVHSRKLNTPLNPLITPPSPKIITVVADSVVRLQRSREFGVSRRHAGRH